MSKTNIYVLSLEGGRYYIGKSDDVIGRLQQHFNGSGSAWTKKYKPISLVKTIENVSPFEEDKITKEYMSKYGIEKVRGGSYVEVNLSNFHIDALKMEIWAAKDLCTQCGRAGHFVKDCHATTDVSGNKIEYIEEWVCEICNRTFTNKSLCSIHENTCKSRIKNKDTCYRCGRIGHYSSECYAKTNYKGYTLDSENEYDSESEYNSDYDSD
jgi:predicted GIY-YIG superfamily endonuclease